MNWQRISENEAHSGDFTIKRSWLVTKHSYTLRHREKLIGHYDSAEEAKRMAEIVEGSDG